MAERRIFPRSPIDGASSGDGSGALVVSLKVLEGALAPQQREQIMEQVRNSAPGKQRKIYQSSISMTEEEMAIAECGRANMVVRDEQVANMLRTTCQEAIVEVLPPLPRARSGSGSRTQVIQDDGPSSEEEMSVVH